jgi:uncharacterized glyoxalase superfamily protein PhnB
MTDPVHAQRLRIVVDAAAPRLAALADAETQRHPAPGKWSPREVLGHLVDSASNNHQRFVRAAAQDDLVFPGYEQERWVELQRYQEAPWGELVALWAAFNRQLARVMAAIPAGVRTRPRPRHNLDEIAWRAVPRTEPATLDYFMADYVAHLEHHLRQVLGADWDPTTAAGDSAAREPFTATELTASLTVKDIRTSLAWYRDLLGFAVAREFEREGRLMAVSLRAGSVRLLIGQDDGIKGLDRAKGEGFSLQITTPQSVDAIAHRIKSAGGTLATEPTDTPWGPRMFRVQDPDGFRLTISSER